MRLVRIYYHHFYLFGCGDPQFLRVLCDPQQVPGDCSFDLLPFSIIQPWAGFPFAKCSWYGSKLLYQSAHFSFFTSNHLVGLAPVRPHQAVEPYLLVPQSSDDHGLVLKPLGGFLSHGGTPSHHPFRTMGFPTMNHPAIKGYPHGQIPWGSHPIPRNSSRKQTPALVTKRRPMTYEIKQIMP